VGRQAGFRLESGAVDLLTESFVDVVAHVHERLRVVGGRDEIA